MLFCFLLLYFLKGSVTLTQSLTAIIKKNHNHGFLRFLNSVSSLRHLPNSAVKNGTNVALLFLFFVFLNFLPLVISVSPSAGSPITYFPPGNQHRKKSNISVRTIFKSPCIYFVIEMLLASVESWNMIFFFSSSPAHLSHIVMV